MFRFFFAMMMLVRLTPYYALEGKADLSKATMRTKPSLPQEDLNVKVNVNDYGLAQKELEAENDDDKDLEEEDAGEDDQTLERGGCYACRRRSYYKCCAADATSAADATTTTTPAPLPPTEDVVITEIGDPADGSQARFVELYSKTGGELTGLSLQKWLFKEGSDSTKSCALSGNTRRRVTNVPPIPKNGFLIVCDNKNSFDSKFSGVKTCDIQCDINMDGASVLAVLKDDGEVIDVYGVRKIKAYGTAQDFKDGRAERNACVGAKRSWRATDWSVMSPGSGTEKVNADGFNPGTWYGSDSSSCGKTCVDDRFLLEESNNCLKECPPGYYNEPGAYPNYEPGHGGKCKKCLGTSTRRRATRQDCSACPRGMLSEAGSDGCVNAQTTCLPDAERDCYCCLREVAPEILQCIPTGQDCFHPGSDWCGAAVLKATDCQSFGLACWYKLLCQGSCVCGEWKANFCGGEVGNEECHPAMLQMAKMAKMANSTSVNERKASLEGLHADDSSLEESLTGKRSC